jgi:ribosomal protein L23
MNRKPPQALLYVPPSMTKTEVKEYLTKIYNIPVLNVMTANFLGKSYLNLLVIYFEEVMS